MNTELRNDLLRFFYGLLYEGGANIFRPRQMLIKYNLVYRLIKIKEWVDKNDPGSLIIPFSGVFEHKLVEEYSDSVDRKKFLEDNATTR